MSEISNIVLDGKQYTLEEYLGLQSEHPELQNIVINGVSYTIDEYIALHEELAQQTSDSETEEQAAETQGTSSASYSEDVSYIVLNGEKHSIDDAQATSDLSKLTRSIAREYDSSETYAVGNNVIYQGILYVCIAPIETPEEWNDEHWKSVILTEEISEKQSYEWGNGLQYDAETNTVSVEVVDDAIESDNRPISSNGVWKEIGNVAILLGTI